MDKQLEGSRLWREDAGFYFEVMGRIQVGTTGCVGVQLWKPRVDGWPKNVFLVVTLTEMADHSSHRSNDITQERQTGGEGQKRGKEEALEKCQHSRN